VLGVPSSTYAARSTYLPALVIPSESNLAAPDVKRVFREYPRVAPLMFGDYYPLAEYGLQSDRWIAWQFDRPEQGQGMVQAFRRAKSEEKTALVRLRSLDPQARYRFANLDTDRTWTLPGRELLEQGLRLETDRKPDGVVVTYERIAGQSGRVIPR